MVVGVVSAQGPMVTSWRYYRPSNTGIQGDWCEAIHIPGDGNPWIGGYDASFEEGGIAKYLRAEDRWVNISNVDYPVIGHPERTGTARVSDIDVDAQGRMWMATGRGGLLYDPAIGPTSLRRFGDDNSPIPGGWNRGVEIAPDGTVWFSSYSTVWGFGGLARYTPSSNTWLNFPSQYGDGPLSIQPKPGGGYYVYTMLGPEVARLDSTTMQWFVFPAADNNPATLVRNNATDAAGNTWMYRYTNATLFESRLDLRRPDGTWVNVPKAPFDSIANSAAAIRATLPGQAIVVDGGGTVYRFNGSSWVSLGMPYNSVYMYDIAEDAMGNIWTTGAGGASRRDVTTGLWERFRVTNTSQYDFWNNDLSIDPAGNVYACANAGPGFGGMVKFDGVRWTGINNSHYGKGIDWPFPTDNSQSVLGLAGGKFVVNPMYDAVHEYDGTQWNDWGGTSTIKGFAKDSLNRVWALGEYFDLKVRIGQSWNSIGITAWGNKIQNDPSRAGTVYAATGHEVKRADATGTLFARTIEDFPELNPQSDTFSGLAAGRNGIVWIGCTVAFGAGGSGGALIRLNCNDGTYTMMRYDQGWPFPGQYVQPLAVAPDGRVWMQYDSDYLVAKRGLCSWDGRFSSNFPAPPNGEMQWGGLPHAGITDMEVKRVPFGYELWMACASRGIAVLRVRTLLTSGG